MLLTSKINKAEAVFRALGDAYRTGRLELMNRGGCLLGLQYQIQPEPRYGYRLPPHEGLRSLFERDRAGYEARLRSITELRDDLGSIPFETGEADELSWSNAWLSGLDAAALYAFIARERPATYLEIGSGFSTRFARRAIDRHGSHTRIVSIDPEPRAEIDAICDETIRTGLESADLSLFDRVSAGDIVFLDSSHHCFTNSDVTVFFLEILPRLAKGVYVHVHDVFLPYDYPPDWNNRFYSEQYLLAALILGGSSFFDVILPHQFIFRDKDLSALLVPLWDRVGPVASGVRHSSFWIRTR